MRNFEKDAQLLSAVRRCVQNYDMIEDGDKYSVTVNGKAVEFKKCDALDGTNEKANISSAIVKGENQVIVKCRFYQNGNVYYALFGEDVGAGIRNCMTYDTEFQAPILVGKFGVYAPDMQKGKTDITCVANTFYIDELPKTATDLNKQGFTFFAGRINIRRTFVADGNPLILRLKGRFHYAGITVNGKKVGGVVFGDSIDVSSFVKKGENVLDIELYSGNRNLYGPHHSLNFETDNFVEPSSFDMSCGWENGQSKDFTERYAFSRFGLFD